jgi:xanthine/uracil/vitamin C permease (AzgA family)
MDFIQQYKDTLEMTGIILGIILAIIEISGHIFKRISIITSIIKWIFNKIKTYRDNKPMWIYNGTKNPIKYAPDKILKRGQISKVAKIHAKKLIKMYSDVVEITDGMITKYD